MKTTLLSVALLLGTSVLGNATIIDSFNGALNLNIPSGGANPSSVSGGNTPGAIDVVGGSRGVTFTRTAGNGAEQLNIDLGGTDFLEFASGSFDTVTAFLQWDGDTNPNSLNTTGLGGIDLTEGAANDQFVIAQHSDRPSLPGNSLILTLTVYTGSGTGSATFNSINTSFIGPFVILQIPFASFSGTPDFADVGAIELFISGNSSPGADLAIDYIETNTAVPEPATLVMSALGLLGVCLLKRRR